MSQWKKLVDQVKALADDRSDDPRANKVMDQTRAGASRALDGLGAARRTVTQDEAWAHMTTVMEEIIDVVVAQQAVSDELVRRVGPPTEDREVIDTEHPSPAAPVRNKIFAPLHI